MICLCFVAFGTNYARFLIHHLYGPTWAATSAPAVLALYCMFVMVLGVNGITEAFVNAAATPGQLRWANAWLWVCTVAYVAALVTWGNAHGAAGVIAANCLNFGLRIAFSVRWPVRVL